ncbi:membrane-bound protein [Streptococcus pneumoniae 2070335]|nr:membrane-bound protein [Streptococcus pneumoniae 2070335]
MKKSILTTLLFAVLYFLCMGIGVLLGNLFDQTGNMFYAPAFTALVGGSVYMILVAKVPRFGAITTIGLVIAFFSWELNTVLVPSFLELSVAS